MRIDSQFPVLMRLNSVGLLVPLFMLLLERFWDMMILVGNFNGG